eukprot:COSAG02_NODE_2134_length_9720_cov_3.845027_1_plen_956_part_00
MTKLALRVGQYNLLCPTYGVKWGEREACEQWVSAEQHGGSNWDARWPALRRVLEVGSQWDLLTLQELEDSVRDDVEEGVASMGLVLEWFDHPGRADAVGIAYAPHSFSLLARAERGYPAGRANVVTGRLDLRHISSGATVRVLSTHQRGGTPEQLSDLFQFAVEAAPKPVAVTVIGGDFNEELQPATFEGRGFRTLARAVAAGEPAVSRPAHKQDPSQTSGQGKIDFILVSGESVQYLQRDQQSCAALMSSHCPCKETGEWPTDHGMEAFTIYMYPPLINNTEAPQNLNRSLLGERTKTTMLPQIDGNGATATVDAEISQRLPRSYALLMHLQSGVGIAQAAEADDPVLAITQAKAAEATLRTVEAEVRAQERRSTKQQRRSTLSHYPFQSRPSSRSSSALGHYTGRLEGEVPPPAQASDGGGTLQQFRTLGQPRYKQHQLQPQRQRFEENVNAKSNRGVDARAAITGDRLSNQASAAWHHRLAQGRRSVEMWHDTHADYTRSLADELTRAASRVSKPGGNRLVSLPVSKMRTGSHVPDSDNVANGQTAASMTSDDSMWFAAMAPSVLGRAASDTPLHPKAHSPADANEGCHDRNVALSRGLVSSGSAVSGMSGFTEAGYPPPPAPPDTNTGHMSVTNAQSQQARRVEWEHYAPLPLRRTAASNVTQKAEETAATATSAPGDTEYSNSKTDLDITGVEDTKSVAAVKAVDGYAIGTGWRPLTSTAYMLGNVPSVPTRESAVTPPQPAPPTPPPPAPAPAAILRERTAPIAGTAGAQTAVALQTVIDRETEIERLRERLHAAGSPSHAVERAARAHIASVPMWHASTAAAAITEPTPLKLLATILGRGTAPDVTVGSPTVESDTEQVDDPEESVSKAASKLQAHERGRQARARARAQVKCAHTQNNPELIHRRDVVADIAAIVGEVLAKVDMHVNRTMATMVEASQIVDDPKKPGQ